MKLYGFWRSLATYRVKVALALKGLAADDVSIDLLKGRQHNADGRARVRGLALIAAADGHPLGVPRRAGQVVAATAYFKCDVSGVPACRRIYEACMKLDAFANPHPLRQRS